VDEFTVKLGTRAYHDLNRLESSAQKAILQVLRTLALGPFTQGRKIKKLKGMESSIYRLRVDSAAGSFRILFSFSEEKIYVLRLGPKKDTDRIIKSLRKSGV
jgi:mRNA-degrading endonuclease RelE of RelBE toxin-antitoxin system